MANELLQVKQVSKVFGDQQEAVTALQGVEFSISTGEFVVILGPSGCGKTTLLRMLAGLEFPSEGRCFFDSGEIKGPGLQRSYLFQEPRLFPWLTVEQNIRLTGAQKDIAPLVAKMGLEKFLKAYPHQLSGGMAKRASLARALLPNPKTLLLDEPLANLDGATKYALQQELLRIWQTGITCVLVTHDVDEALALATRILLFSPRPGKIIQDAKIKLAYPRNDLSSMYIDWKQKLMKWIREE